MQREQVAEEIGCSTESLRRWYVEGKKQGLVTKAGKGKDTSAAANPAATTPAAAEPAATSAPHDPGAGLGEHEVKSILDYKKKHPSMGPAQIRAQLKRFLGWRVSVKAIARVLRTAGYAPVHRKGRPVGDEHPRRFDIDELLQRHETGELLTNRSSSRPGLIEFRVPPTQARTAMMLLGRMGTSAASDSISHSGSGRSAQSPSRRARGRWHERAW